MDNTCEICGGLIIDNTKICANCTDELRVKKVKKDKEIRRKKSWKYQWEKNFNKEFWNRYNITNPYTVMLLMYFFLLLFFLFFFSPISDPLFYMIPIIGPLMLYGIKLTSTFGILICFYRFLYFVFKRITKGNPLNKKPH